MVRFLSEAGIVSYYIENNGTKNFLCIFSESGEFISLPGQIVPESIVNTDEASWLNSWAEKFKGYELTHDIYVTPEGAGPSAQYEYVITIDPHGAFGDGHHPTTRLCAYMLQEFISRHENRAMLNMIDVGTGSGLLAVEAYILGVRHIELFDIDPTSVRMAAKNLHLNGAVGIEPFAADIYSYTFNKKYDIITANLLTGLIEDNISLLTGALDIKGVLILSGISRKWTSLVRRLIKRNNLVILEHKKLEGWNGFLLKKK